MTGDFWSCFCLCYPMSTKFVSFCLSFHLLLILHYFFAYCLLFMSFVLKGLWLDNLNEADVLIFHIPLQVSIISCRSFPLCLRSVYIQKSIFMLICSLLYKEHLSFLWTAAHVFFMWEFYCYFLFFCPSFLKAQNLPSPLCSIPLLLNWHSFFFTYCVLNSEAFIVNNQT